MYTLKFKGTNIFQKKCIVKYSDWDDVSMLLTEKIMKCCEYAVK